MHSNKLLTMHVYGISQAECWSESGGFQVRMNRIIIKNDNDGTARDCP